MLILLIFLYKRIQFNHLYANTGVLSYLRLNITWVMSPGLKVVNRWFV